VLRCGDKVKVHTAVKKEMGYTARLCFISTRKDASPPEYMCWRDLEMGEEVVTGPMSNLLMLPGLFLRHLYDHWS
jgi:hypothetical protein